MKQALTAIAGLALPLALFCAAASPAQAIVAESHITAPGDPTYMFDELALAPTFTVAGTANVSEVEIRCYDGPEAGSYTKIYNGKNENEKVTVFGGVFLISEPESSLPSRPCVLRAVPAGDTEAHPPGAPDPFSGPRVLKSAFGPFEESGITYDYDFEPDTFSAYLGIDSAGSEALYFSYLFAPGTLEESENGFYIDGALRGENRPPSGSATRSELQIDGLNAFAPDAAYELMTEILKVKSPLPGTPSVSAEKSYEPLTGEGTVHETDPIVRCAPEPNVYPPTSSSCTSFVSTGVQLSRAWQATHGDHVALMNDAWTSTDGKAHALDALYDQEIGSNTSAGSFQFPGTSAFVLDGQGQSVSLPSGAGAIYYKVNATTPEGGDMHSPQLAIVYDSATDGPLTFHAGSNGKERADFEMHYARTIPAGGSYDLSMGYVTEYALGAVRALAGEILATYPPHIAIASPANGTSVSTPAVTVTGSASASDTSALAAVAVNGHRATPASNGSWSVSVPLSPGANTLTAVATDQAGLTASQSVTVSYVPTRAVPVGRVSGANGRVRLKIACEGLPGQTCTVAGTLTTREQLRGSKPLAVSARHRRRRPRTRTKTVTVGAKTVTIPVGETVTITIALDGTGRRLLARFHKLPVRLSVVMVVGTARSTVISQSLTVKPAQPKKPRKHHRRRHRRRH